MLLVAFLLLIYSAACAYVTPTGCTPFGVRLALGRNFFNTDESETLSIRFNTRLQCPKSYVTIERGSSSIRKIYCSTKIIQFNSYSSFSHECSINFLERGDNFEYMAYGWTGNSSEPEIPFKNSNMKSRLISQNQNVKMVVLADWGYL